MTVRTTIKNISNSARYAILALVCLLSAQAANAQFRRAVIAGANFTNLHFKQELATVKANTGMQLGLQGEMMFPGIGFGIDLGLIYNMAGAHVNLGERLMWSSQGYGNENLVLHQVVIPFHLRFKYTHLQGLEEIIAPFVYAGPDINLNVAHTKCDAMTFAGGDVGLSFGAGVELYKRWQLSGAYSMGMTYAMKAKVLQEYSSRTRQWSVRLAYFF